MTMPPIKSSSLPPLTSHTLLTAPTIIDQS
jgi:hypothetical protein